MTERIDAGSFHNELDRLSDEIASNAVSISNTRQLIKGYERDIEALSDRLMLDVLNELAGQRTNAEQRDAELRARLRQHADAKRLYAVIDSTRETLDTLQSAHDMAVHRRQNLLAVLAYETAYLYHTAGLSALTQPRPSSR